MSNAFKILSEYIQQHEPDVHIFGDRESMIFCNRCFGCKVFSLCEELSFNKRPSILVHEYNKFLNEYPEYFV